VLAGDHIEVGDDAVPPAAVLSPVHLHMDMRPGNGQEMEVISSTVEIVPVYQVGGILQQMGQLCRRTLTLWPSSGSSFKAAAAAMGAWTLVGGSAGEPSPCTWVTAIIASERRL
jgi:hypothetical protein